MSYITYPLKKSYNQLFEEFTAADAHSNFTLSAASKALVQITLEAQKDALRNLTANGNMKHLPHTLGASWDYQGHPTSDWKSRALVLRKASSDDYMAVVVTVRPKATEEGTQLIQEAMQRMDEERKDMGLIESILLGNTDELKKIYANPKNFKPFELCPVVEINVVHAKSTDEIHKEIQKVVEDEWSGKSIMRAKLNSYALPLDDDRGYSAQAECSIPTGEVLDVLQTLSEIVQTSPELPLVDYKLSFLEDRGIENYTDNNAEIVSLIARKLRDCDGLVTDGLQNSFTKILNTVTNKSFDVTFLEDLPEKLRNAGHIDEENSFSCNDMRHDTHIISDTDLETVVGIRTEMGTLEIKYHTNSDDNSLEVEIFRTSKLAKYDRLDCNIVRKVDYGPRQVGHFKKVEGELRCVERQSTHPTDASAVRDVILALGSAHTITVCLEEENRVSPPSP